MQCHQDTLRSGQEVLARLTGSAQSSHALQFYIINKEKGDITSWEFGVQVTIALMKSAREITESRNGISEPNSHKQTPKSTCAIEKPFWVAAGWTRPGLRQI